MWSRFTCPIVSVCSGPCVFIVQILKLCVLAGLLLFFEFVVTCCSFEDFFTLLGDSSCYFFCGVASPVVLFRYVVTRVFYYKNLNTVCSCSTLTVV